MKKIKFSHFLLISLVVLVTTLTSVALVACNKDDKTPKPQSGAEVGVYYYDAGIDEYTVVLGEGTQFTMSIADMTRAGSYILNDDVLTFKSNKQDDNQISAVLKNNVIILTYNGAEYRFLKKINFAVSFDSKGGSAVSNATVINGKKVAKPADPTKNGYIFVGWYEDENLSNVFSFNSHVITADTTLFARWVDKQVGGVEFVADFKANNGGADPEAQKTIGGNLYNLPVVERVGYTFKGWWVSMSGDDRLSYEFVDGMSLDADTTLHAVWQADVLGTKLAAPLVNVEANAIRWNSVGAREYKLQVQGPDGNYIINKTMGGTVEAISFDSYPAGDYIITVTAVATTGEANNAITTRLYKNKALARVSQFSIIEPSVLLFNGVENAEKYLITVNCGDKNHNHVNFDNGLSTHFNFADCMMQNSGIKFIVTAVSNGYASSVSKQYVYAPTLDAITEFELDEQTQMLVWNKVVNATGYMVSVKCGNVEHSDKFINVGSTNSISLKECAKCEDGIVVKVFPISEFYISPKEATFTFDKQNLATPQEVRIKGTVVSWTAVAGATSYDVNIAGITLSTDKNSIDISGKVALTEKADYALTVVAKGENNSLATDPIDARNLAMADNITYANSVLSWTHVIGAAFYEVQVNEEPVFSVSNGANFANIDLTNAGENTLKVRFISETGTANEWVSTSVYAHTLTFVSDGGNSVDEQYKAVGDIIELPTPQKEGYNFLNWYNTPKGPESNGAAFKQAVFSGSSDLVLYACYTPKSYTIKYHYGDGGNSSEESDSVYYQNNYTLVVPKANEATSAFGGWFSAPNGNGVQYTDDKGNSINPWNRTSGADVYAFWFDDVLSFTLTSNAGRQMYSVMQGSRISQVSEVTIPHTYKGVRVGMLAGNAFKDCSNLITLNIPNTIESISAVDPFTGCTGLDAINVYDVEGNSSIRYWSADGVLFDNGSLDQQPADPSQIKAQISYMPLGKTGSYTIPNGIAEIPTHAFASCALSRVVIPSSVTLINMEAFKDSANLTTIVFDTGSSRALTIADGAFTNCTSLVSITLPARLNSIPLTKYELLKATGSPAVQEVSTTTGVTNAFVGCKNLNNIYIAGGNKTYKAENGMILSADGATLLYALPSVRGEIVVPTGVSTIANGAFIGCNSISKVTIPSTVTMVGECAFYDTGLEEIIFGNAGFNDVTIGKYAFRACDSLESVIFEEGSRVAHIGEGAFYGCDDYGFERIELPAHLKSIGAQAFRDCENLEEVVIASISSDLTFGSDVFYNCESLKTLRLPKNVSKLPGVFSGCTSLEQVIVDPENQHFTSVDGVLFDKEKTNILFYPQNKTESTYSLPDSLTTISDGVFRGNRYLVMITIGKNVSKIGNDAFRECSSLEEVIFAVGDNGAGSLEIGSYAFYDCDEITTFALPARTTKVGEYAFAEMNYLTSFTINEGLEEISDYMLYNAQRLPLLDIPAKVKSIGNYAFYRCGYWNDNLVVSFATGSKLTSIGNNAFEGARNYKATKLTVELPSGLQYIGYKAFYSTDFAEFTIPNTVKVIGAEAFASNSKLKTVTFEAGGTDDLILGAQYTDKNGNVYEGKVFTSCYFESIDLPARTTFIGNETFDYCSYLKNVTFGENSRLKHIGAEAFYGTKIQSLTIPKNVANGEVVIDGNGNKEFRIGIGKGAFSGIHTLEVVNFEDGGTESLTLGDGVFNYMNGLTTLNLPSRIADYTLEDGTVIQMGISDRVFSTVYSNGTSQGQDASSVLTDINIAPGGAYCSVDGVVYNADKTVLILCPANKTGTVTVLSSVIKIERNAFANAKLTNVQFAGGTADMVIGERAFYGCNSITEVVLSDNVVEIQDSAFAYCKSLTKITLSANLKAFDPSIFTDTNIQQINVSIKNNEFTSDEGVIFSKDMKTLILYPSTAEAESYTVPNGVTKIAENAFRKNNNIKTVVLPAGLKEIGVMAFAGCDNLTNVVFPNTVEIIGSNAFNGCSSLGAIKFETNGTESLVIENNAFQNSGVTSVEFPSRLISIGSSAFYRCSALNKVTFANGSKLDSMGDSVFSGCSTLLAIALPQGLNVMGSRVFENCTSLVSATFGEGLMEIGDYTFKKCASIETVSFPASLKTMGIGTFADNEGSNVVNCSSLKSVMFAQGSKLEVLPEGTFYLCTALERFTVPASVTMIATPLWDDDYTRPQYYHYGVFQDCTSLKSLTFEEGSKCKEIGNFAFYGCTSLESFAIPTAVSRLGISAFQNCQSITDIVIPATATVYGKNLFNGCTSLVRVTLNEKATALADGMFTNCSSLKQLNIPASVTIFGSGLLSGTAIESFVVPSKVTELPYSFFSGCKSLVSVELPSGLKKIGASAFSGCTALTDIEIPDGVTEIGDYAFQDCYILATLELPADLETVGRYAFRRCTSLTSITIPSKVTQIDTYAFYECFKLVEVYNASALDLDDNYLSYYAEGILKIGDQSIITTTSDGFKLYIDGDNVKVLGYSGASTAITLPANATAIYEYAFSSSNIVSVTIPAGVTSISDYAFYNCPSLTTVVMQGQVTSIGNYAFSNCAKLTSVNLPNSVSSIGNYAFEACASLVNISLPTNLTSLGSSAFRDCVKLSSIIIPEGITRLSDYAFAGCSSLKSATLPASLSYMYLSNYGFPFKDCISLENYSLSGDSDYYKVVDGVLYKSDGATLISVPAAKKGTFIVPKEVNSIEAIAFVGSQLDMLKFETGRASKFYLGYSSSEWIKTATVKAIVISTETFSNMAWGAFEKWSLEQTVYFVQTKEEIDSAFSTFGTVNATVVYGYQESTEP